MKKRKIIIAGIAVIFVVTAILLLVNLKIGIHASVVNEGNVREITIDAKRFEYNPDVIKIKVGEAVRLKINNIEGEHGFSIPELGIEVHDEKEVEFIADKKGTFDFYCHHYCGSGHSGMKGVLIVE